MTNIEPGLTETEPATHVSSAELSGQLDEMFGAIGGLTAAEVADVVAYATSRPGHGPDDPAGVRVSRRRKDGGGL